MQDLEEFINQDTELTTKFLNNFEQKATDEANLFMDDIEKTMDNRFLHQDEKLNNMSRFISKFQNTLKIFGKDV